MKYSCLYFCVVLLALVACDDKYSFESREIKLADKVFMIPEDWQYWSYSQVKNANNEKYDLLRFNLSVEEYLPYSSDNLEQKKKALLVSVGPVSYMDKGHYWTEKDTVLKQEPLSCKTIASFEGKFELCDHGVTGPNRAATRIYSIKDKSENTIISILSCTEGLRLPNPMCNVRARFMGNLQINYGYSLLYFEKALEIDRNLREIIFNFYKSPLQKGIMQ